MIALVVVLIVLNGVFVMSEMALVTARKARLAAAAERGDRAARAALLLAESPNTFLSTAQIGITLIGILLGAFGEASLSERLRGLLERAPALAGHAGWLSLIVTVLVIAFVSVVFAELVPKRLGQTYAEPLAKAVARPMTWIARAAAPVVWLLGAITDLIMRALPVRQDPEEEAEAAEQEVRTLIATGAQSGMFQPGEQRIVERVFNLSDRKARSLMVPRRDIHWIPLDASPARVRVAVAASPHSHFPVCRGGLDEIVGVVHIKDLVKVGLIAGEDVHVQELMREPLFVPESTPALKLLDVFQEERTHVAFVLDEYGVMEGLVTLNDVLSALVGDITTGPGGEEPRAVKREDGSLLVDGMMAVGELKDLLDVETLPKEEELGYETLGGFVMSRLGRVPTAGDRFTWDRFGFEVMDMDKTRVDKVLVTIGEKTGDGVLRNEEGE